MIIIIMIIIFMIITCQGSHSRGGEWSSLLAVDLQQPQKSLSLIIDHQNIIKIIIKCLYCCIVIVYIDADTDVASINADTDADAKPDLRAMLIMIDDIDPDTDLASINADIAMH